MKVEVGVLGSPSLIVVMVSGRKAAFEEEGRPPRLSSHSSWALGMDVVNAVLYGDCVQAVLLIKGVSPSGLFDVVRICSRLMKT